MTPTTDAAATAARLAVRYALAGLVIAVLILLLLSVTDGHSYLKLLQLVGAWVGAGTVLIVSRSLGRRFGDAFAASRFPKALLLGVATALGSLLAGVLVGSLPALITDFTRSMTIRLGDDLFAYIVKPLFFIFAIGGLPAILLGMLYGTHVRRTLARDVPAEDT